MPERGDLLLAERSTGGHRNVAEALQHDPPTQRSRLSSPGTAQLDHSCLDRRLPSPARSSLRPDCVRRPGSDDELAPLGLDSVLAGLLHLIRTRRKVLKDWPNQQAGRAILSLSDWYKTSGRSTCRLRSSSRSEARCRKESSRTPGKAWYCHSDRAEYKYPL